MFHLSVIIIGLLGLSVGALAQHCPTSSLTCEKVAGHDNEYVCQATAQYGVKDDPPQIKWSVSAGQLTQDDEDLSKRRLNLRDVDAPSVTVTIDVSWAKMPRCKQAATTEIKLR